MLMQQVRTHSPMEQQVCVDILSVIKGDDDQEGGGLQNQAKPCDHFMSISVSVGDDSVKSPILDVIDENKKEKRKKGASTSSAKKPPKPPRPQRGFSLDAADQNLIKELTELAMIKRARIERMKALMQQKKAASKASSSSSSTSSLFAMIFTIIVFIVLLFQGMSCQISCGTYEGSPPHETNETGLIFIHEEMNPSAADDSV